MLHSTVSRNDFKRGNGATNRGPIIDFHVEHSEMKYQLAYIKSPLMVCTNVKVPGLSGFLKEEV